MNNRLEDIYAELIEANAALDRMIGKWTRSMGMGDPIEMGDWIVEIEQLQQERDALERQYWIQKRQNAERRMAARIINEALDASPQDALAALDRLNSIYTRRH